MPRRALQQMCACLCMKTDVTTTQLSAHRAKHFGRSMWNPYFSYLNGWPALPRQPFLNQESHNQWSTDHLQAQQMLCHHDGSSLYGRYQQRWANGHQPRQVRLRLCFGSGSNKPRKYRAVAQTLWAPWLRQPVRAAEQEHGGWHLSCSCSVQGAAKRSLRAGLQAKQHWLPFLTSERVKAMLFDAQRPEDMWEAAVTATFVKNRSSTNGRAQTARGPCFGRKPDVSSMRVFGARAYVHVPKQGKYKLD